MPDLFPIYDVALKKRGRKWIWSVTTTEEQLVMVGAEASRSAASYRANSALFLLLQSSPYRLPCATRTEYPGTRVRRWS